MPVTFEPIEETRPALMEVFTLDRRSGARTTVSIFEGVLADLIRELDTAAAALGPDARIYAERVWLT